MLQKNGNFIRKKKLIKMISLNYSKMFKWFKY